MLNFITSVLHFTDQLQVDYFDFVWFWLIFGGARVGKINGRSAQTQMKWTSLSAILMPRHWCPLRIRNVTSSNLKKKVVYKYRANRIFILQGLPTMALLIPFYLEEGSYLNPYRVLLLGELTRINVVIQRTKWAAAKAVMWLATDWMIVVIFL
jgi:hypothetical protein